MKKLIILMILVLKLLADKKLDLNFFQNDYHLVQEWFEIVSFDKKYINDMSGKIFKYNRTVAALNVTIDLKVDLDNSFDVLGQAYKFASNEYREFPMRVQVNFCQAVHQNLAGMGVFSKCGNLTDCRLSKGRKYHFCNFTPDESKLPPFIPTGKYMLEGKGLYNSNVEIFTYRTYVSITRPILGKN